MRSHRLSFVLSRLNVLLIGAISGFILIRISSPPGEYLNALSTWAGQQKKGTVPYNGIENCEWCQSPKLPPLPYERCQHKDFLLRYGVYGGLTNALHFLLKGSIWAFQENLCFFVDERGPNPSKLAARDPPQHNIDPFLERYFEPIGLPRNHKLVKKAFEESKFAEPGYNQIQFHEFGKFSGGILDRDDPVRHTLRDIEALYIYNKDNIWIKKYMIRRMFRILPMLRENACARLKKLGLDEEYLAMSIRRGDKSLEYELDTTLQPYMDKAEIAIRTHFDGRVPTIFVASDDCGVMVEVRELRPDWRFVGECDNASESNGFVIAETKQWTTVQTDQHYEKFVTEMIALASAKYFIGISTTNVALWVYFMRHFEATDDSWAFVDNNDMIPH